MNRDEDVDNFFRGICLYYKTFSNRIDFLTKILDDSSEEEQRKIKQEVKQNDCDTQSNH